MALSIAIRANRGLKEAGHPNPRKRGLEKNLRNHYGLSHLRLLERLAQISHSSIAVSDLVET